PPDTRRPRTTGPLSALQPPTPSPSRSASAFRSTQLYRIRLPTLEELRVYRGPVAVPVDLAQLESVRAIFCGLIDLIGPQYPLLIGHIRSNCFNGIFGAPVNNGL